MKSNNKIFISIMTASILVITYQNCGTKKSQSAGNNDSNPTINEPTQKISAIGSWGGDGVSAQINETKNPPGNFTFDCANGRINNPISLVRNGSFNVPGTYQSAIVNGIVAPPVEEADYTGTIELRANNSEVMNLTVIIYSGSSCPPGVACIQGREERARLGPFILVKNQNPNHHFCR